MEGNTTSGGEPQSFCQWENGTFINMVEATVLTTVNSVCALLAILGNALVILAVYRSPELRTPTNYLITSLAAADLQVGALAIPLWIWRVTSNVVDNHHVLSKLSDALTIQTLTASTYSLCAVTIERCIAIDAVYRYVRTVTLRRCVIVIAGTWTLALAVGSLRFVVDKRSDLPKFYLSAALISIAVPFLVIGICYMRIYKAAQEQNRKIHALAARFCSLKAKKQRRASRTIAVVVGVFVVCWSPVLVVSFLDISLPFCLYKPWLGTVSLSFSNSVVNVWIYTARNCHFRRAFRRLLGMRGRAPLHVKPELRRRRNAVSHEQMHVRRAWSTRGEFKLREIKSA